MTDALLRYAVVIGPILIIILACALTRRRPRGYRAVPGGRSAHGPIPAPPRGTGGGPYHRHTIPVTPGQVIGSAVHVGIEPGPNFQPPTMNAQAYTPDEVLTASGGWTVPIDIPLPDIIDPAQVFTLPEVTTRRGGITYQQPTPTDHALGRVTQALIRRAARDRHDTIEAACLTALRDGYDIHIYDQPLWGRPQILPRHIGITFTPARYPIPTIHEHGTIDATYDDDEDWNL